MEEKETKTTIADLNGNGNALEKMQKRIAEKEKQKKGKPVESPKDSESKEGADLEMVKKEITIVVNEIFSHERFNDYSKNKSDRLNEYKEEILDELAKVSIDEGVDKGDIATFMYEFLKGKENKPKKVISILLQIIRDIDLEEDKILSAKDDLSGEEVGSKSSNLEVAMNPEKKNKTETEKEDKKDKKSVRKDENEHSNDDKLPDHEKAVFIKNKKELRENIEGYKKSLKQILNKLKEKFDKFLEEDLRDNPENAEIRRKFFQAINHYEDEVKDILQSSEYSERSYKKIKKIHSKIGNDLLMEWSVDKIKGRKKADTSIDKSIAEPVEETGGKDKEIKVDIENSHDAENKKSDAQEKDKKAEFGEKEMEVIEGVYVEIAKRNIEYLESEDFSNAILELGYDEEDIEELRKIEIKRFWKKTIVDELESGGEFSGEKMEKAINIVKEKIK